MAFIYASNSHAFEENDLDKCKSTDLVLIIDSTYSLKNTIYDIKLEIEDLLKQLAHVSNDKLRIGLVTFKDDITVISDLDDHPNSLEKRKIIDEKIYNIIAYGGGAGPEASDEALRTVINALPADGRPQNKDFTGTFTSETKIIILITDNRPGGFDDIFRMGTDDVNAAERAFEAAEQGILISSIYIPPSFQSTDEITESVMRDYALITGGLFIRISSSGEGAADAIANIIDSCGHKPMV